MDALIWIDLVTFAALVVAWLISPSQARIESHETQAEPLTSPA